MRTVWIPLVGLVLLAGCPAPKEASKPSKVAPLPLFESPAEPAGPAARTDAPAVLIRNATIMTAAGLTFAPGHLLMRQGRIAAVGAGPGSAPDGAQVIDAKGAFVTPGLIDTHSHMGVFPLPYSRAMSDGNESSNITTPEVWAEHAFWPQDPSLPRAVAGGITTIQVLPGSTNLVGGRSFVAKLHPATSARAMRFPGAPQGLKMACGENPKTYHDGFPKTRMGNVYGYRRAFQQAYEHRRALQRHAQELARWQEKNGTEEPAADTQDPPDPPARDFGLETLVAVLDGDILPQIHCYRADEMHVLLDIAEQYGFTIRSFHHAVEAYKLADRLAAAGTATSTWADWWGFKIEAFDGIPQNAAILTAAGARAIIHSDSPAEIRHLNHEVAKAIAAGRQVGIEVTDDQALRWVTANPAWALGVEGSTGTLEVGKMADVVLWNGHPFSVYSLPQKVFIDGVVEFDRSLPLRRSDFEVGLRPWEVQP